MPWHRSRSPSRGASGRDLARHAADHDPDMTGATRPHPAQREASDVLDCCNARRPPRTATTQTRASRGADPAAAPAPPPPAADRPARARPHAAHRGDRCSAQAYVRATRHAGGELLFCAHHGREHIPALAGLADIHDESDRLMEPSPVGGSSL